MKYLWIVFGILFIIVLGLGAWQFTHRAISKPEILTPPISIGIYEIPTADIVARVTAITLDPNESCKNKCPSQEYPIDHATLVIEQVTQTNKNSATDNPTLRVGDTINAALEFSGRPTKVSYIPETTPLKGDPSSNIEFMPASAFPAKIENGLFVYEIPITDSNLTGTITLPGLTIGNRIKTRITLDGPNGASFGKYDLVK